MSQQHSITDVAPSLPQANHMLTEMLCSMEFIENEDGSSYVASNASLNMKMSRDSKFLIFQMMVYKECLPKIIEASVRLFNENAESDFQITDKYNANEVFDQTKEIVEQICSGEHRYSKDLITPEELDKDILFQMDIPAPHPGVLLQFMVGPHSESIGKMYWVMIITPIRRIASFIDGEYRNIVEPVNPDDRIVICKQ